MYPPRMTLSRLAAAATLAALLGACGRQAGADPARSTTAVAPVVAAPPVADPAVTAATQQVDAILIGADAPIHAFAMRLPGVPPDSAGYPTDFLALAAAAADAYDAANRQLHAQTWPTAMTANVADLENAIATFSADLRLLAGLVPRILPDWQAKFSDNGATLNAAVAAVDAMRPPG
jgi:hypothetical protein